MPKELYISVGLSLFAALVISFAATPIVKAFARHIGAIDVPKDATRMHDHPVPLLGGLAIFLGFLFSVVLFANITRQLQGILIGAVVIVIVGVIDDIRPMKAMIKLIFQIVAALIAVFHGVEITILSNPLNTFISSASEYIIFGKFAIPVTVLWIVAITNSVNLIDGLDGLAAGVSGIASAAMLIIAVLVADVNVAIIMAALAGACMGFLPYNINPAKIFMGDTGALMLGYILATVSILGLFKFYAVISFAVPFLVVGLPLFDTVLAFSRRILSGRSPMSRDRSHFHHRLIDMGLSQKEAVAILYAISAILGLTAVVVTTSGGMRAFILLISLCVAGFIGFLIVRGAHSDKKCTDDDDDVKIYKHKNDRDQK